MGRYKMITKPPMMIPTKIINKGSKDWLKEFSRLLRSAPSMAARFCSIAGSAPFSEAIRSKCQVSISNRTCFGSARDRDSPSGQPCARYLKTCALKSWLIHWLDECAVMRRASGKESPELMRCPSVRHQYVKVANFNNFQERVFEIPKDRTVFVGLLILSSWQ